MSSTTGQVYLGNNLINNLRFDNNSAWTRPTAWIAMPAITSTEQKAAALFLAGDSDSNFVAFRCAGNYTVDWGDGFIENVASGVTAQHNYVFSSLSASTELGPTGSKSRQAMIVITPQAGQNLTSIQFNFKHTSVASTTYTTPILEITLSAPNCTTLLIGGTVANLRLLEQCTILSHNAINLASLFQNCSSLQSVPLFNTSAVTAMNGMFQGCSAFQSVPLFNTLNVLTMSGMFQNCTSLSNIPLFNTSAVTNMSVMFQNCSSLQSVPLFNTAAVINMSSMFQNCFSLQSIPAFNCSSVTNMSSFAAACHALKRCQATGVRASVSFATSTFSASNLNEIYTNLANLTSLPTQTITVTGNYGTATDDPTIATAKNWTVTG
jgi:surface protein